MPVAVLTRRGRRRVTLIGFLVVFAALHAVGALTDSYEVLLATRALSAFTYGGFWSVASVTVLSIVPAGSRGKAISVVAGGLTVATVVGLPLGTLVGQNLGWRAAFWAVPALSLAAAALTIHNRPDEQRTAEACPLIFVRRSWPDRQLPQGNVMAPSHNPPRYRWLRRDATHT